MSVRVDAKCERHAWLETNYMNDNQTSRWVLTDYYHLSNSLVAPMSMDYQKSLQKPKLGNGEVASHYSLQKVAHYEFHCNKQEKYMLLKENPMHQRSATEAI